MKKYVVFIILWSIALSVQAAPIRYKLSGQINYLGEGYEDFTGSWVLSDPTSTLLGEEGTRGDCFALFSITGFSLASVSYSLNQAGSSAIALFWEEFPPATYILIKSTRV